MSPRFENTTELFEESKSIPVHLESLQYNMEAEGLGGLPAKVAARLREAGVASAGTLEKLVAGMPGARAMEVVRILLPGESEADVVS